MSLELRLTSMGYTCWLDQKAATITKEAMQAGVAESRVFLLFLSEGVLTRPFCLFEIQTALSLRKRIQLMHETDARHGAFHFSEAEQAPAAVAELLETHESLPWRRRRFEQDAILSELIRGADLGRASAAGPGVAKAIPAHAMSDGPGLVPIPDGVPMLPESISPRGPDRQLVLDVLLGRTSEAQSKNKLLAHGMGGLGKTMLSAAVA